MLVEKGDIGGICVNKGCIPAKAWLANVKLLADTRSAPVAPVPGCATGAPSALRPDIQAIRARKQKVVRQVRATITNMLAEAGVSVVNGIACFVTGASVVVETSRGDPETLDFDKCILATGSCPARPAVPGVDLSFVVDGEDVFDMDRVPGAVAIVGGGVMGVELAYLFAALGSTVTVIEMVDRLLPTADDDVSAAVGTLLEAKGIVTMTSAQVAAFEPLGARGAIHVSGAGGKIVVGCDLAVLATGRRPAAGNLNLERAGIAAPGGWVKVDDHMRTTNSGAYAVGDVTGGMLLAHVASAEGAVAAENAMGNDRVMDLTAVPTCVHISPEIAWVGVSEKEARLRPGGIRIGVFPMAGVGKAIAVGDTQGFVKVISGARYGEILGVHMVGPNVTEVISTAVAAIRLEATAEFLGEIIHPHPTISEALMEAARRAAGTSPYVVRER